MADLGNNYMKKSLSLNQNINTSKKNINKQKKNSLTTPTTLDRHPSAIHLGEQKEIESLNVSPLSFNGVNVILAKPNINNDDNPYTFSLNHVNEKVFESNETYYMKNDDTNIQLTFQKKEEPMTFNGMHKSFSAFTNKQKILDGLLTECIQNGEGYDKVEEAFSSLHTFKKD